MALAIIIELRKLVQLMLTKFTDSIGCYPARPLFGHQLMCYMPVP